jgi:hypothetical protein
MSGDLVDRLRIDHDGQEDWRTHMALRREAADTIQSLEGHIEVLAEAHQRIMDWVRAYPLRAFPEPDMDVARQALEARGLTLDCVSASNMRHVITQVAKISEAALAQTEAAP